VRAGFRRHDKDGEAATSELTQRVRQVEEQLAQVTWPCQGARDHSRSVRCAIQDDAATAEEDSFDYRTRKSGFLVHMVPRREIT